MSRLIKRYENRKLYDVGEKRYVSLEEIADRIRCGADVTVIENATGSDITAQTLAKLFAEDRNALQHPMAAELLHHLVRLSGSVVAGGVEQLLQGVDRAIEVAIERLPSVRLIREEMAGVRRRLEDIDRLVRELEDSNGNNRSKSTDGTDR